MHHVLDESEAHRAAGAILMALALIDTVGDHLDAFGAARVELSDDTRATLVALADRLLTPVA